MPEAQADAEPTANIGVVGLAVMGSNLARNLASREGNTVAVFNRSRSKTDELVADHPEAGFVPAFSYEEFAAALATGSTKPERADDAFEFGVRALLRGLAAVPSAE